MIGIKKYVSGQSFKRFLKSRTTENDANGCRSDDTQLSSVATSMDEMSLSSIFREPCILPPNDSARTLRLSNKDQVKKYCMNSCRTVRSALETFNSPAIREELHKFQSILFLKFRINGNSHIPRPNEFNELSEKCKRASVVILISSKNEDDFLIYWKSKEIPQMLTLKPYKEKFKKEDKNLCEFTAEFLVESLFQGSLGLKSSFTIKSDTTEIEFNCLADSRDYNLLFLAAEIGKIDVLKSLLKSGLKTIIPDTDISIQFLAYKNRHFNVLLELLKENFSYPPSMDVNVCSEDVKKFYETSCELHKMIKTENSTKIIEILKKNLNLRYFYNLSNESALTIALANKSFTIYRLLVDSKMFFGPHENVDELLNDLRQRERRTLREINYNYLKSMPQKHLNILMANSLIGSDVADEKEAHDMMLHAFSVLNRNPMTKILLRVVAASRNFQIIFDFNRDSIHVLNPTAEQNTKGLYSTSGKIFIGAKELLDNSTEDEAFGTLAHELCHYALNVVYENNARPYLIKHKERFLRFVNICEICEDNCEKEQYINLVYNKYPSETYHAELIVRVPHLVALYHNNPEKLKQTQENFPELFEYYEKIVMPELESALPKLKEKAEQIIEEQDKRIYYLKRRFYFAVATSVIIVGLIILFAVFNREVMEYLEVNWPKVHHFLKSFVRQ